MAPHGAREDKPQQWQAQRDNPVFLWHWVTLCVPSFAFEAALWPWCSRTDAGGRGQQGDLLTLQGLSVPGGPRVLSMGRLQWQPWGCHQ